MRTAGNYREIVEIARAGLYSGRIATARPRRNESRPTRSFFGFRMINRVRCFRFAALMAFAWMIPASASAEDAVKFKLTVRAGNHARLDTPVCVAIDIPSQWNDRATIVSLKDSAGNEFFGELTPPGLGTKYAEPPAATTTRELHFVLPHLAADGIEEIQGTIARDHPPVKPPEGPEKPAGFHWLDVPKDYILLTYDGKPVMKYMDQPIDESSKESREKTFKVYHHVFDPEGEQLITKGPGGLYTHHRGLFYGFQRITYNGGKDHCNIWECPDAFQSHEGVISSEAGPVLGRHLLKIDWHAEKTGIFAHEEREMTAYHVPGGTMIDFVSTLRAADGPVHLDGDPQHAGFQFRAAQEVAAKTHLQTYYIRPSGNGKPGETINWDPKEKTHDPRTINLPWKGMSFVLGTQRYTAALLDRPDNPKEARFSERDYGRFGSYFVWDLSKDRPLTVHYRVWVQRGEMSGKQIAMLDNDFVDPVEVVVQMK
jgi:hypothetical protein